MQKRNLALLIFTFAIVGAPMAAQQVNADLHGSVTDPQGNAVAGAGVTATNTETHVSSMAATESNGTFEFLSLPVGNYDVTVIQPGFATFVAERIPLDVAKTYELPVKLQLGSRTDIIQVEAASSQIESSTTQLTTVIEARKIVDLPLIGRNWTNLQQLAPGVVAASDHFGTFATNGSQSQQNSFLINGMDAIDLPLNTPLIIPSPDAIGEFNLITSTINPEYGRNSGAILNALLKSGTNQFHGTAFEFFRDTFLDDRNFFEDTKPIFHQHQFGGVLDGPIRKDRTFFMFSYQGVRARQPQVAEPTVFTQDQRNGGFPDIASSTALSPFPLVGENGAAFSAGTPYKTIFPTGRIPAADFNSISRNLVNRYVPLPNLPGGQYAVNGVTTTRSDQEILRVDHTLQRNLLWGSLMIQSTPTQDTLPFTGANLPGFGDQNQHHTKTATAAWTHTFAPTMINEFRVNYIRFNFDSTEPQTPVLPSSVGFTGITPQNTAAAGVPLINLTGYFRLGFSSNGPQPRVDSTYQLTDNVSKIAGNHLLKMGIDFKRYQVVNPFYGNNNGSFSFSAAGPYSTGDPGADFLLGIPDSYSQGSGGFLNDRTYEYYFYAQDSWKVRPTLTLNYGTGYQIDTPLGNQAYGGIDKNCFRPGRQSSVFPTAPSGLVFPGDSGCTTSGYTAHYGHFAPRFGFAWSPGFGKASTGTSPSFVVRGGVGVYYNRTEAELALQDLSAVPFSETSGGISDAGGNPSFADPWRDIATGQTIPNKFPFTPPKPGSIVNFASFEPMSLNVTNPNFTSPYALNYNLNVERALPSSMVLTVGYVGSFGRHLLMAYEGNPISPAGQAACAALPRCIANRLFQSVLYPGHTLYAPGNVLASVGTEATEGVSNYNSLQVGLKKQFTHRLAFQLSYTWSHSIDDTSGFEQSSFSAVGLNPYNFRLSRGDSTVSVRPTQVSFGRRPSEQV